jgi:hypothetical protein
MARRLWLRNLLPERRKKSSIFETKIVMKATTKGGSTTKTKVTTSGGSGKKVKVNTKSC